MGVFLNHDRVVYGISVKRCMKSKRSFVWNQAESGKSIRSFRSDYIRKAMLCNYIHATGVITYQSFRFAFGLYKNLAERCRRDFLYLHIMIDTMNP